MKIEISDLSKRYKEEKKEILKSVSKVLKSGKLILSDSNRNFENLIKRYTKTKYWVTLSGYFANFLNL